MAAWLLTAAAPAAAQQKLLTLGDDVVFYAGHGGQQPIEAAAVRRDLGAGDIRAEASLR